MTYDDDNILSISGIQHFVFCRRQWALIHIEQQWAENEHTVIGELMHKSYLLLAAKLCTIRLMTILSRKQETV